MATSPNYSWPEPDNTDLVKNGALAMRTLGNAIDTTMATMTPKSLVDAKGDLIAATANDTPARLAVGNNGETLVADSSTSTGLGWTGSMAGGKNAVIGGGFDYWQRGTSFNPSSATYAYTADRWEVYTYAASTCTVSQQSFTAGAAPVAGVEGRYFLNIINTNTGIFLRTKIEDVRTFAGQTVTLSFYAKASTNLSLASNVEQNFGTGGSTAVSNLGTHNITTSWQRFTRTVSVASISGKTISSTDSSLQIIFTGTNNVTLSIWGVQLEYGSVATQFSRAGGTLQGELAAARRYYQKFGGNNTYEFIGQGFAGTTTSLSVPIQLDTPMRVVPTSVDFSTLCWWTGGAVTTISAATLQSNSNSTYKPVITMTTTGVTANSTYGILTNNSTSGYIALNAEL